jgi:DNA-binding response OmpR family regulator
MASLDDDILIVEDEALIAYDLVDLLSDAGFRVRGPFVTAEKALDAVREDRPALALLDVNLGDGKTSEAVAEALSGTGTPVLFVSGYNPAGSAVLRRFSDAPRISKPWDPEELISAVKRYVHPREAVH